MCNIAYKRQSRNTITSQKMPIFFVRHQSLTAAKGYVIITIAYLFLFESTLFIDDNDVYLICQECINLIYFEVR